MDTVVKSPSSDISGAKTASVTDLKVCGVCGDKALGYNFNAVTCESCKAFFRRNALKNKEFRCPFNECCDITTVTRRFCQRCRLVKCLLVGMRKDYIMSEEDKVMKRQKIELNRAKKRPSSHSTSDDPIKLKRETQTVNASNDDSLDPAEDDPQWTAYEDPERTRNTSPQHHRMPDEPFPSPTSAASVPSPSSPPDSATVAASRTLEMVSERRGATQHHVPLDSEMPLLSSLINNGAKGPAPARKEAPDWDDRWNQAGPSRLDAAKETMQDVQRFPIAPNSIESILSEAIKLEFEAYSSLTTSHQSSRELNDAERAKLNELIVANKALHEPLDDDLSSLVGEDCRFKTNAEHYPMLLDVINLTAIAIRRLIKASKKINAFKNMCQEDQVALLKGGCTEILILRSAMTYDPDKDSWNIPHTQERLNVKVDVLKEARGNIYEEHQRFLRTFDPRWRTDENIMLILSAITLFTPDRPRVVHHDVIKLEQNSYYYLLRRYLESVFPGCEARSTFLKLIQKISELHRLNDDHVRVYLDVNPRDVEPLLIEIFDLKPH